MWRDPAKAQPHLTRARSGNYGLMLIGTDDEFAATGKQNLLERHVAIDDIAATVAHLYHFKTTSFAQHMALGTFYEEMPGLVDSLVEAYQGKYGLVTEYPASMVECGTDPVAFVTGVKDYVAATRGTLPDDSELQNLVDEIAALAASTLYKLTFLS